MILLPSVTLPPTIQQQLDQYQQEINQQPDYAQRVASARIEFSKRNIVNNQTFRQVRATLTKMCSGARRCCYCEDSVADEVEHIQSKDLYPELVFVWSNYLYACGPCNGPKNNRFAIIMPETNSWLEINRRRNDPVIPPPSGQPAIIDPRCENPFDFLELDLLGTFYFNITSGLSAVDKLRAKYTLDILHLNDRDYLVEARRSFYISYRARLVEYIHRQSHGESSEQLETLVTALKRMGHPTVWLEMQRQHLRIPDLAALFAQAPEALTW